MRKEFEDGSYLEFSLGVNPGKVAIVIGSKDIREPLKTNVTSAEITIQDFCSLIYGIGIDLPRPQFQNKESDENSRGKENKNI